MPLWVGGRQFHCLLLRQRRGAVLTFTLPIVAVEGAVPDRQRYSRYPTDRVIPPPKPGGPPREFTGPAACPPVIFGEFC